MRGQAEKQRTCARNQVRWLNKLLATTKFAQSWSRLLFSFKAFCDVHDISMRYPSRRRWRELRSFIWNKLILLYEIGIAQENQVILYVRLIGLLLIRVWGACLSEYILLTSWTSGRTTFNSLLKAVKERCNIRINFFVTQSTRPVESCIILMNYSGLHWTK
jgi:hypothetical protein